jgi:hypothetical protein
MKRQRFLSDNVEKLISSPSSNYILSKGGERIYNCAALAYGGPKFSFGFLPLGFGYGGLEPLSVGFVLGASGVSEVEGTVGGG